MINGYDIAYAIGLTAAAPFWLARRKGRQKLLRAVRQRAGTAPRRRGNEPAVMIHAVSLGEINATGAMVRMLGDARPDLRFIISTTTDTGYARARELYGADERVTLIRYPLDFTPAVSRLLDGLRPDVVALMELEVWPNFVAQCARRGIPVGVLNGRLTRGSFGNYRFARPLLGRTFRRLAFVCAQEQTYAERFLALGALPSAVRVTGTMKFDTAQIADEMEGAEELAAAVGLRPGDEPVLVCGSTGPGEEQVLLNVYRELLQEHPRLRLVLVPRKPERFDEAADLIRAGGFDVIRRSSTQTANRKSQIATRLSSSKSNRKPPPPIVLGDTMGELRKFYSLADVVFVGRTLLDLGPRQHGSDMIEPAALGKPVIVGPFTGNFAEVMNRFRASDAIREVRSAKELSAEVNRFLSDPEAVASCGRRAQEVVRRLQGATRRHVELVLSLLAPPNALADTDSVEEPVLPKKS